MPVTPRKLQQWKQEQRPISVLTAWDYPFAQLLDQAGIDVILVGDSLAMVALGFPNTLPLTLDQMVHHGQAVGRGVKNALIVCDMPFLSYQPSTEMAIASAGRILKETTAQAVKLEGASPATVETITRLTEIGIPVMGHIGLTPQSVHQLGYRQQGTSDRAAQELMDQAKALKLAGIFALVLEHIPSQLAEDITNKLSIPTIGIGAGAYCDGQVLVTADLLGLSDQKPPFAKAYANLRETILKATTQFIQDVQSQNPRTLR